MSLWLKSGIIVRIKQLDGPRAPRPLPLESGFSLGKEYEIIGMHCASETSEAFCVLVNDLQQLWFISNRHLEVVSH